MAQNIRPMQDRPLQNEPSLGELFGTLARETATLVRQEVDLARTEITTKAMRAGKDIGFIVAGGVIIYAGVLALCATAIIALAYALPWWLAALIVGVVVTGVGAALVMRGISALKTENLAPRQTIKSLKEDAQWAGDQ